MNNSFDKKNQGEGKINPELWSRLSTLEPSEVCRRSVAHYDETKQAFKLKILNRDYTISLKDQTIKLVEDSSSPFIEYYLQVAAINYLTSAKDIPLDGRWVSEKEFPNGLIFFRGPHAMPNHKLEKAFGQDAQAFALANRTHGGKKIEAGDIACELLVFPRIPVRLVLWMADEEFPARVSFLFDRTANVHLQLDGLYAVGKVIEAEMLKAVP